MQLSSGSWVSKEIKFVEFDRKNPKQIRREISYVLKEDDSGRPAHLKEKEISYASDGKVKSKKEYVIYKDDAGYWKSKS